MSDLIIKTDNVADISSILASSPSDIKYLEIRCKNFSDSKQLKKFENLDYLVLDDCSFNTLDGFPKVKVSLSIARNNITNLAGCPDCKILSVIGNKITDVSGVWDKKNLKTIHLSLLEETAILPLVWLQEIHFTNEYFQNEEKLFKISEILQKHGITKIEILNCQYEIIDNELFENVKWKP